jgi:hypothetical protein
MSIAIFERTDKKSGIVYRGYVLFYTEDREWKQKRCRTLDSSNVEAQKFIRDRTEHQPHQREISLSEFADWSAAMRMLRGRQQTTLVEVVSEWARAHDALGGRGNDLAVKIQNRCRFEQGTDGVPAVASFSPLVRRDAHQTVSQLSPGRASVAAPEMAEYFAWIRLRAMEFRVRTFEEESVRDRC